MKEFIEKLIEGLEEEKEAYSDTTYYAYGLDRAIKIANQLAEKYKNSIPTTDYDSIIAFIESEIERTSSYAEHYTQISIMDYVQQLKVRNNNGWIPCSERLPETYDNLLICQSDGYVNVGYYSLGEFKDVNSILYKDVIAWQPLPDPYKE